jgi:type II secretory pathway component GspD/PulD (secretin)
MSRIVNGKRGVWAGLALLMFMAALAAAAASHAAVEVIPLNFRSAAEVLPLVKSMLSPEGRISADERTNSLIVVDSEEAIARVKNNLAALDRSVPQALVRVRFIESGTGEERSISGSGRVSGDGWSVSSGRRRSRDGVDVRVQDESARRSGSTEAFIRTLSGTWAYIRVGRDIPFTVRWRDLCRRYGQAEVFQRMETGFDIKPVIQENTAIVELVPRLTDTAAGRPGVVRFAEAAAQLRVPLDQWVTIGGSEQAGSEAFRAILETGSSRQSAVLSIQLMVQSAGDR